MRLVFALVCLLGATNVLADLSYFAGAGEWKDGRGERDSGYLRLLYVTDFEGVFVLSFDFPYSRTPVVLATHITRTDTGALVITAPDGKEIGNGGGNCFLVNKGSYNTCDLQFKDTKGDAVVIKLTPLSSSASHVAISGRIDSEIVDFAGEMWFDANRTALCHEMLQGESDVFASSITKLCLPAAPAL